MSLRPYSRLVALCVTLLAAGEAAAAPSWLELRWPDVAGCPTREEVEATAVRLTAGESPQPVTAEASITTDAAGYTLDLRVRDRRRAAANAAEPALRGAGRRDRRDPRRRRCADRRVRAGRRRPAARRCPRGRPHPAPRHRTTGTCARDRPRSDARTIILAVASATRARYRLRCGRRDRAESALHRRPVRQCLAVVAAGPARPPRQRLVPGLARASDLPGIGVKLQLAAGAVRGCPRLVRRTIALELCAGLELGALLAEGAGLQMNDRSRGLWAAGLLAPGVRWQPLRWLSLGVEVEGLVAFTRRRYRASDADALVYTVPPVGVRLGGGLALHIF
ncbi:hypothetical protein [Nannocystis pusilla]|uniref:hypothetical protein n=1 Tax=Nannocystis pusilla TaxID=889268 RepID=UPI003B796FE4